MVQERTFGTHPNHANPVGRGNRRAATRPLAIEMRIGTPGTAKATAWAATGLGSHEFENSPWVGPFGRSEAGFTSRFFGWWEIAVNGTNGSFHRIGGKTRSVSR